MRNTCSICKRNNCRVKQLDDEFYCINCLDNNLRCEKCGSSYNSCTFCCKKYVIVLNTKLNMIMLVM